MTKRKGFDRTKDFGIKYIFINICTYIHYIYKMVESNDDYYRLSYLPLKSQVTELSEVYKS